MSGSAGIDTLGVFPGGITGSAIADAASVSRKLDRLTAQIGDGYISDTYAGLGSGLQTALVAAPAIAQQQAWQANINAASGTMQVAQTALTQIGSIASTFYADIPNLNGLDPSEVDTVAASAQQALVQVAGLLNSTDGTTYVFGGQDTTDPPVPDADSILSSGFFTQIQSAVGNLAANGAAATNAATLAVASSNAAGTSPFSAYLSQPASTLASQQPVVIGVGGQPVQAGILASTNAAIASQGTATTGSYMRDILMGLATLGSLSSSQVNDTGFSQVVQNTYTSLGGAISALSGDAGVLGNTQTQLQTELQTSANTVTALQSQLGGAQDVDMASTISQLTQTQTQLQASYRMIADTQSLSLVGYLAAPAA